VVIDTHTGALPLPGDPDTMTEVFLDGTQPTSPDLPDAGPAAGEVIVPERADAGVVRER
jgi:hypothetical protein